MHGILGAVNGLVCVHKVSGPPWPTLAHLLDHLAILLLPEHIPTRGASKAGGLTDEQRFNGSRYPLIEQHLLHVEVH